jgi:hypothetical protein
MLDIEESLDMDESLEGMALLPMSDGAALLSGVAMLESDVALDSVLAAAALFDGEHPARARPAMAARMATTEMNAPPRAEGFNCGILGLRVTRPKHPARRPVPKVRGRDHA